jgi:alkylhydroperoxidase family enzyme
MMTDEAPRLRLATDDEVSERFKKRHDDFTRIFAHNSEVFERWNQWYGPIIRDGAVPARLKEIVRLRVAQLNACDF